VGSQTNQTPHSKRNSKSYQSSLGGLLATYTFENWREGVQEEAMKYALAFFEDQRSIVFWSKVYGSGKTFAACAILHRWLREDKGDPAVADYLGSSGAIQPLYFTPKPRGTLAIMPDVFSQIKSAMQEPDVTVTSIVERLQSVPLLVMDDLCRTDLTKFENDIIYRIVNHRYNQGMPVVITTNVSPAQLGMQVWSATVSRLHQMGRFVHLEEVDLRL